MSYLEYIRAIGPELVLTVFALLVMTFDALMKNKRPLSWISLAGLIVTLCMIPAFREPRLAFGGMLIIDPLAVFFKVIALGSVIFVSLMSLSHRPLKGFHEGEYNTVLLLFAVGVMFLVGSVNLLMIFLALEMVSLGGYLLTAHLKREKRSSEAALKFFLFGALCSGLFLYGITILYGFTGTLSLSGISAVVLEKGMSPALGVSFVLVVVGIGFKIALAPFHMWCPDAYEGAPTPITALLSVASKAAGFAVLIRLLLALFPTISFHWEPVLWVLAVASMTIGNVIALRQSNLKRLLAYSSIAQAGYVLVGIVVMRSSDLGMQASLIYLFAYLFMNLGAFAVIIVISNATGSDDIEACTGLSKRAPLSAAALTIFLVSLTGIPPLAGFVGKFYIFAATVEARAYTLAVIVGLNSAIAAFYYFRVVKQMYLTAPTQDSPIRVATPLRLAMVLAFAGTVIVGVWPTPFLAFASAICGLQ